jgi:hypothetical protein
LSLLKAIVAEMVFCGVDREGMERNGDVLFGPFFVHVGSFYGLDTGLGCGHRRHLAV